MFDPLIIAIALACGLISRIAGLPALIGYLAAGFVLNEFHIEAGPLLESLANIGITLLLFTIGLKLQPGELLKPRIWGTTFAHLLIMQCFFLGVLLIAGFMLPGINLNFTGALIVAFALTFSSTIFVIQVLQDKGEMSSRHAAQAIGILLIQDIAAVLFPCCLKRCPAKARGCFAAVIFSATRRNSAINGPSRPWRTAHVVRFCTGPGGRPFV